MITYANLFCFCAGTAVAVYRPNLVFAFPAVVAAIIAYFNTAVSSQGARLEPEQLLKSPMLLLCILLTLALSIFLIYTPLDFVSYVGFFRLISGGEK